MRISDWSSDVCSSDLTDAQTPEFRVHTHFHAVQNIAIAIVPGGKAATRYLCPVVRRKSDLFGHDERCAMPYNYPFVFSDKLSLGKVVDLTANLRLGKGVSLAVNLGGESSYRLGIGNFSQADYQDRKSTRLTSSH